MSGLEKFQNNELWRKELKEHLLMERKPQPVGLQIAPTLSVVESVLLKGNMDENKENKEPKGITSLPDTIVFDKLPDFGDVSDDSFAMIEKMCDKTASDPNSTLFKYMHRDQQQKKTAKNVKEDSLSNLLNNLQMNDQMAAKKDVGKRLFADENDCKQLNIPNSPAHLEMTNIEDIEAPSKFWDQTLTPTETASHAIKTMQPLIEIECSSAADTFQTASQENSTSYETAQDISFGQMSTQQQHASFEKNKTVVTAANYSSLSVKEQIGFQAQIPSIVILDTSNETSLNDSDQTNHTFDLKQSGNNTPKFNDTVEEVSFMLKQYATSVSASAGKNNKENLLEFSPNIQKATHSPITPKQMVFKVASASKYPTYKQTPSPNNAQTPIHLHGKNSRNNTPVSAVQRKNQDIGEHVLSPNCDKFKKPNLASTKKSQHKDVLPIKNKYSHIVSPIGAYIKNTATTPLMDNIKVKEERKIVNTKAVRQLSNWSSAHSNETKAASPAKSSSNTLPKKAYISSNRQYVIDQRSKMIPGGEKMQKCLEPATSAAVVRHEGKMKFPSTISKPSQIPRRAQDSLANLSVASGDVSLYTVKDAHKYK